MLRVLQVIGDVRSVTCSGRAVTQLKIWRFCWLSESKPAQGRTTEVLPRQRWAGSDALKEQGLLTPEKTQKGPRLFMQALPSPHLARQSTSSSCPRYRRNGPCLFLSENHEAAMDLLKVGLKRCTLVPCYQGDQEAAGGQVAFWYPPMPPQTKNPMHRIGGAEQVLSSPRRSHFSSRTGVMDASLTTLQKSDICVAHWNHRVSNSNTKLLCVASWHVSVAPTGNTPPSSHEFRGRNRNQLNTWSMFGIVFQPSVHRGPCLHSLQRPWSYSLDSWYQVGYSWANMCIRGSTKKCPVSFSVGYTLCWRKDRIHK